MKIKILKDVIVIFDEGDLKFKATFKNPIKNGRHSNPGEIIIMVKLDPFNLEDPEPQKPVLKSKYLYQWDYNINYSNLESLASQAKLDRDLKLSSFRSGPYDKSSIQLMDKISQCGFMLYDCWVYKKKVILVEGCNDVPKDELIARIKHSVLLEEKKLTRIKKEVEAFENMEKAKSASRERIPESVRLFVWQRDEGKCVKCGNREKLEYDHIIPVAEGGSTTERNIQLLCEKCNREKGKNI
jgi:hypothetical protein